MFVVSGSTEGISTDLSVTLHASAAKRYLCYRQRFIERVRGIRSERGKLARSIFVLSQTVVQNTLLLNFSIIVLLLPDWESAI